jgi:hypothetical protein
MARGQNVWIKEKYPTTYPAATPVGSGGGVGSDGGGSAVTRTGLCALAQVAFILVGEQLAYDEGWRQ